MWDGYLQLAGNEVINNARAVAYAGNAGLSIGCEPCDSVAEAVGDDPYWTLDETAPWWDAASPASKGFLGVYGIDVSGFNSNTISRTPTPLIGQGAALGPARRGQREVAWTVALITTGEAELSYALEWLSTVLLGSQCSDRTCAGDEMCVFSACPGTTPLRNTGGGQVGDAEIRHLYDVGLLSGPSVTEKQYLRGGQFIWATVSFTLAAGKPWIYHDPLPSNVDWVSLGSGPIVPTVDPDQVYQQCLEPKPCAVDPMCGVPALPPKPPRPLSPCYTTGLGTFRRSRIQVSPLDESAWLESVPVLEVRTGKTEMRRLLVRFWANPQNNPCDSYSDPCNACADINVSYLPAGSTLRMDGRVQRAVVECPQYPIGTATSTPTVYGTKGDLFQWPTFPCPTGLCIEIWSRSDFTAPDATARVLLVPRADLG
ncbi:hypothetical protein ACFPC0_11130 [Streptomyces andamanensis]|uniref:Minor tail protein n=1 Tax=Streptomyces andamanensis TaxID=1565035 RepID=A0ABV8TCM6_9ACTN